MKELTREQALKIYNSGAWKTWTNEQIVQLQLYQDRLCVGWDKFREAIEDVLGRGVYTHEFAFPKLLQQEYEKNNFASKKAEERNWTGLHLAQRYCTTLHVTLRHYTKG